MLAKSFLHQCIMVGVLHYIQMLQPDASTPGIILKTRLGIDWFQKVPDLFHFGEILDLFRGGKLFILPTVHLDLFVEMFPFC